MVSNNVTRTLIASSLLALACISGASVISGCSANAAKGTASPSAPEGGPLAFAGKSFYVTYDNGRKYLLEFTPDGKKQRYTGVIGKSNNETVDIETSVIAPDIYLINWIESAGVTVTRVDNLATNTVTAYWTWEEKGKRLGELHIGKLEPTDMTRERLFRENPTIATNPPEPAR